MRSMRIPLQRVRPATINVPTKNKWLLAVVNRYSFHCDVQDLERHWRLRGAIAAAQEEQSDAQDWLTVRASSAGADAATGTSGAGTSAAGTPEVTPGALWSAAGPWCAAVACGTAGRRPNSRGRLRRPC